MTSKIPYLHISLYLPNPPSHCRSQDDSVFGPNRPPAIDFQYGYKQQIKYYQYCIDFKYITIDTVIIYCSRYDLKKSLSLPGTC